MHSGIKTLCIIGIIAAFGLPFAKSLLIGAPPPSFETTPHSLPHSNQTSTIQNVEIRVVNQHQARLVHAPSVALLQSGNLIATWWGGFREGGKDVEIFISTFDQKNKLWSRPKTIQSALKTQIDTQRYIRKLGNAVITQDRTGTLHIFYVSVSIGGWAASSLNHITSTDLGGSWSTATKIVTAPFLNLSTLVKGAPIYFDDGSLGIPVYHELAGKFGELLRISLDGVVLSKTRLSKNRIALQPVIHTISKTEARVLMRYAGDFHKKVLLTHTTDGGQHWSTPKPINIPNPNSAVALAHHDNLGEIGVFNDLTSDRLKLSLYAYGNNDIWQEAYVFENKKNIYPEEVSPSIYETLLRADIENSLLSKQEKDRVIKYAVDTMCKEGICEFQYDYPYLIQGNNNTYHLLYTWNKSSIKHVTFSILPGDSL